MENFWVVTLFHLQTTQNQLEELMSKAMDYHGALGVEEYSLSEEEVDAILGERSYSGGDLPQEVLDEVDTTVNSRPGNFRFFFNDAKLAKSFQKEVEKQVLCESQLEEHPQEDWNAEWRKHYSPIKVNDLLEVVPSWQKDYKSEVDKKIFIYPGMGFGTGSHETTFLCLKLFTDHLLSAPLKTVLDFGSGSGILGLASLLFYKDAEVDFYDIDSEANKNCYHNAEINNLSEHSFRLLLPEVRERLKQEYDLVFANILESILLQEKEALISHTRIEGHLILSGLLKNQASNIIETYSSSGCVLLSRLDKGDWSALLFRREK